MEMKAEFSLRGKFRREFAACAGWLGRTVPLPTFLLIATSLTATQSLWDAIPCDARRSAPATSTMYSYPVIFIAIVLSLIGTTIQIVSLPYWLDNFTDNDVNAGPFVVLVTESILFFLFFSVIYVGFIAFYGVTEKRSIFDWKVFLYHGLSIGLFDALNGLFLVFNASTSRVATYLQLILLTIGFVFSPLMTFVMIESKRNMQFLQRYYLKKEYVFAGLLVLVAIVVISIPYMLDELTTGAFYYAIFYFIGVLFGNVYNIAQEKYPIHIANKHLRAKLSVNMEVLSACCLYQLVFVVLAIPVLPSVFFADTWSYDDMWDNFKDSLECMYQCKYNMGYYFLFGGGYILTYVGNVILNEESAVFTILVSTLTIPISAVLFFLIDSDDYVVLAYIIPAFCLLIVAVVVWKWQEKKDMEEEVSEKLPINS